LEPFGEFAADLRIARLCRLIAEAWCPKKSGHWSITDFLPPSIEADEEENEDELTARQLQAEVRKGEILAEIFKKETGDGPDRQSDHPHEGADRGI